MREPSLWNGFRVELHSLPAGIVELPPSPDHLLSIHAGAPVRATCRCDGLPRHRLQTAGDIDILPAGIAGRWEDESAATILVLRLAPALLRSAAAGLGLDPDRVALAPRFQLRDPRIEHIGWALKAELEAGHPGGRLYGESLGMALAAHLLRCHAPATATPLARKQGLSKPQQRRVLDYIETHLDESLSLAQLAGIAGVSASHFKPLFKQSLGLPVHQYVIRRRVAHAKRLLLAGQSTISEIALVAGFAHQSHMARAMRRVLGVTPAELVRSRR
jgi:AraC family transcriptional regulator